MTHDLAASLSQVTAGYATEHPVLHDVDLEVPARGITRLGGPNGAGKSTTIEVLSGYLVPLRGSATVLGRRADDPRLQADRRTLRTRPALYPYMTLRDHVLVACRARGADRRESIERAERLGLGPWLDHHASALSSGTAKKAWHVLSTVGQARLYLIDEPFNAVDDDGIAVIVDEMHQWARSAAVLVVCHAAPAALSIDHERNLARRRAAP
jgi:ABC-type multidrug transport system ATPase subunit